MKTPISTAFATVPIPGGCPSAHATKSTAEPDDDVRRPERQRRVELDALVEHVPRRQAEVRLEQQHDPAGEEEEPADEADRARDVAAADARRRCVAAAAGYSPNGLKARAEVECSTLFVSR